MNIVVVKIKDTKFNGAHPFDINEGYTRSGRLVGELKVGSNIAIVDGARVFSTSEITKVNKTNFHTLNSVYSYKLTEDTNE